MSTLTLADRAKILRASLKAAEAGNDEEEYRLMMMLPLAPHLAMAAKEVYGVEYVKTSGFDLSEANRKFGDAWLEK